MPGSSQSGGDKQPRGGRITRAGPNPLKAAFYQGAMVAVNWDPELAAFAVRLQDRGLAYAQVMVAVANKLFARAYAVLKRKSGTAQLEAQPDLEARPVQPGLDYELRTPQGQPVSKSEGKQLIDGRYRLKSARRPNPARGHGEKHVGGIAGKTSPDSARQSLAPQPGTAPEGDWQSFIARSACPPDLQRLLAQQTALLEVTDSSSLRR